MTLIVGSTNEQEAASYTDAQFLEATFPMHDRLVFNRAIAGYRGTVCRQTLVHPHRNRRIKRRRRREPPL